MADFKFYQDIKVSVWQRQSFIIEAETKEEADKLAKKYKDFDISLDEDNVIPYDFEYLTDTEEVVRLEDNNGFPTIEIFDEDCNSIANNKE